MSGNRLAPALSISEWTEWDDYVAKLGKEGTRDDRAVSMFRSTMARNNDLLPADLRFSEDTVSTLLAALRTAPASQVSPT